MTAAELQKRLQADTAFRARAEERERVHAALVKRNREEQQPIVRELRATGLEIEELVDLLRTSTPYREAIPVLLTHLRQPYSTATRETLARSLAVREARFAWPTLVSEFKRTPNNEPGVKQGLAVALAATATDAVLDELISLIRDSAHGENRLLLLKALRRSKLDIAQNAIEALSTDPVFATEIASWGKRKL